MVYTDHVILKYLLTKKHAKLTFSRWILLLQEFNMEIKDKKGVENSVVDHLSRMSTTKTKELLINDFLRDDMLLEVETSHCWYANIVNFMVSGYVPMRANAIHGMHHTYTEYVQMGYYEDVYPRQKD